MSTTVTISDDLAAALELRRRAAGMPSLDAAAEALLTQVIALDQADPHDLGLSDDAVRALIDDAETSGPVETWDSAAARAEVRRRFAQRQGS
jgi:hypothetical protein